jgi:hypothetical protein
MQISGCLFIFGGAPFFAPPLTLPACVVLSVTNKRLALVTTLTAGELMRIAKVHLLHHEKDWTRSRRC